MSVSGRFSGPTTVRIAGDGLTGSAHAEAGDSVVEVPVSVRACPCRASVPRG